MTHAVVTSPMRWMLSRGDANLPFVSPTPGRGPSPVPVCVAGSEGTWQELCHSHNLLVGGTENHGLIWLGKDLLKLVSFQWEGHLRFLRALSSLEMGSTPVLPVGLAHKHLVPLGWDPARSQMGRDSRPAFNQKLIAGLSIFVS